MKLSKLNPIIDESDLWLDCPGGCGWRQRIPFKDSHLNWNFSSTKPEDLATLTVTPSVKIFDHSHFTITNGEIIDHKDVTDKYKEG